MAEIQQITDYILSKAKNEGEELLARAGNEYDMLLEQAAVQAQDVRAQIISKARSEASDIERRAISALAQKKSALILELKNSAIADVIRMAKDEILNMPDKDYADFIIRILKCNATGQKGTIAFNEKDTSRLSTELANTLEEYLLTIDSTPADISGGFVLKYGSILINCSLDALFKEKEEQFVDYISKAIFG